MTVPLTSFSGPTISFGGEANFYGGREKGRGIPPVNTFMHFLLHLHYFSLIAVNATTSCHSLSTAVSDHPCNIISFAEPTISFGGHILYIRGNIYGWRSLHPFFVPLYPIPAPLLANIAVSTTNICQSLSISVSGHPSNILRWINRIIWGGGGIYLMREVGSIIEQRKS